MSQWQYCHWELQTPPTSILPRNTCITGVAMLLSDIETFVASPALWVKLALVALLLINGVLLNRTETALRRSQDAGGSESLWSRLKFNAISSLVLWSATLVAGITLV